MIPWECLDRVSVPGNDQELGLYRRGEEFSIRIGNHELMNSRNHGSEESLAEFSCDRLSARSHPRLLIGGLGMGFTTAAALRYLGTESSVLVAELVPAVVSWNHDFLGHLAGNPLKDKRVGIKTVDVAQILRNEKDSFDGVLLDVDNGPAGLTSLENKWLYSSAGLKAALEALRPGGLLAIWSASADDAFVKRLEQVGFMVEEKAARSRGHRGCHHVIWLCTRPRRLQNVKKKSS